MRIFRQVSCILLLLLITGNCLAGTLRSSLGDAVVEGVNSGEGGVVVLRHAGERRVELDAPVKQVLLAGLQGKTCLAVLVDDEDALRLYDVSESGITEIWRGMSSSLKPWKVQIGDVDGDGAEEIVVGVLKKARFHPVMAKRPFVYGWDGKEIYPKWLGSRLSRPFTDIAVADFGKDKRLIAIEQTKDGANELAVYEWNGFGFTRTWTGGRSKCLSDLEVESNKGKTFVKVTAVTTRKHYAWDGRGLRAVD